MEETNELRAKLGLKPLRLDDDEKNTSGPGGAFNGGKRIVSRVGSRAVGSERETERGSRALVESRRPAMTLA